MKRSILAAILACLLLTACGTTHIARPTAHRPVSVHGQAPRPARLSAPCVPAVGTGRMGVCMPQSFGLTEKTRLQIWGPYGVDWSSYQGCPRIYGVRFAVFKAYEGNYGRDSTLGCHIAAARRARIPWGAYCFQRPGDQAAQAAACMAAIRPYGRPPLGVTVDSEVGVSVRATCWYVNELRRLGVTRLVIYTSPGLWPGGGNCGAVLWEAAYGPLHPSIAWGWTRYVALQYSDGTFGPGPHLLSGVTGDSDVDRGLLALFTPPHPHPKPKPNPRPVTHHGRRWHHLHRLIAKDCKHPRHRYGHACRVWRTELRHAR